MAKPISKKLNFIGVAAMYVGSVMGAGFASGRESWQFFGVFGSKAYLGIFISAMCFAAIAFMINYISIEKDTTDIGTIVSFTDNRVVIEGIGYSMAAFLFTTIISMSAAGGSFLNQEFGLSKAVGGGIIAFLVAITVLGDFERISKLFKFIVPMLFAIVVGCSIIVIFSDIEQSGATSGFKPSIMAPDWIFAAFVFVAYNMLGMIPMGASASLNAKSKRQAFIGSVIGGFALGVMTLVLVMALQKDMAYTDVLDLPMLGYSLRISTVANILYGVVLYAAIYSAATSTFYGFTTKLPDRPWKSKVIIVAIIIGFAVGLTGFKNVVAYLYPVEGYYGLAIITMMTVNFFKVMIQKKKNGRADDFSDFTEEGRLDYPENIVRVTAGSGGESLLVFGRDKTALYDTGMAYCHEKLIDNISKALEKKGRSGLDYVLMSHTHYDHIGALPYVLQKWPDVIVVGAAKAEKVFASRGARRTMKRLGEAARDSFGDSREPVLVDGFRLDMAVKDGDTVDLGGSHFVVLETKGHTDCSLTYVLEPQSIMFACESTGVLHSPGDVHTSILKSYSDTLRSAEKCRAYGARRVICPHYGLIPEGRNEYFFQVYARAAESEKDFILQCRDKGQTRQEIFGSYCNKYWEKDRSKKQPREAFEENAWYIIDHILENF